MMVIAGAGLAGLSTAYHLNDVEYRILEKEDRAGGLCRTEVEKGYLFDYGGHLLHFRDRSIRSLVYELLADNIRQMERNAGVYSHGVITDYPFQVNLYGLPKEVIRDCLVGFCEALLAAGDEPHPPEDYHSWIHHALGEGIARHFMLPFNRKFWCIDLGELQAAELLWSIPRPSIKDVVEGALGISRARLGYNPSYGYPLSGGMEALVREFTRRAREVETNTELIKVIPEHRVCVTSSGEEITYRALVSTMPLPRLISIMEGVPENIRQASARLRWLEILCVNLGVQGPPVTDRHWIYFPDSSCPFHRLGVYTNFYPAPSGRHSMYLEISGLPGTFSGREAEFSESAVRAFSQAGFLGNEHRLDYLGHLKINCGYVIMDKHREECLPVIMDYLRGQGIHPAGRYGRWEYSTMEDAIRQGRDLAGELSR